MGDPAPLAVIPPGVDVTMYEVIGAPAEEPGLKLTVARPSPAMALSSAGGCGTGPAGSAMGADTRDGGPLPTALVAITVNW